MLSAPGSGVDDGARLKNKEIAVRDAIQELEKRITALDAAQEKYELELPEEQLDADIEGSSVLRETLREPLVSATAWLSSQQEEPRGVPGPTPSVASSSMVEAKLPKLDLLKFGGDCKEWCSFWEQFEVAIDSSDLPPITKFAYLRSVLAGEAKAAIQGLSLRAANYASAVELLKERFGRKEKIVFMHVQELLNAEAPQQTDPAALWKFYDFLQSHIRSLAALDIRGDQYGVLLTPIIVSRLTPSLRKEWARQGEKREGDLTFLLEFLKKEVETLDRSSTFASREDSQLTQKEQRFTASALYTASPSCPLCSKPGHSLVKCFRLTKGTVTERKDRLQKIRACFRCLSVEDSHSFKLCDKCCSVCGGKHHRLLCSTKPSGRHVETVESTVVNTPPVLSSLSSPTSVLLQMFSVKVQGPEGEVNAVVLLDTGSDRSFISRDLVKRVKPRWVSSNTLSYASFGSGTASQPMVRGIFEVDLPGVKLHATEVPVICATLQRPPVPREVIEAFKGKLAEISLGASTAVDILIGLDQYWEIMTGKAVRISDGLIAQESRFGWILSGKVPSQQTSALMVSSLHVSTALSDTDMRRFWELDCIGISDSTPERDAALVEFERSIEFDDGRYKVKLPWKDDSPQLMDDEQSALKRLEGLNKKLERTPLGRRYDAALTRCRSRIHRGGSSRCPISSQGILSASPPCCSRVVIHN
ncbi:MAG: DUF1759 domain-containing protein [Kangiellaceae bacterium]|nr:DUF1759 domain-containing protein [Kangiellaceae bacterium]